MQTVDYRDGLWVVTDDSSNVSITAEQLVVDFDFVRGTFGRGTVRIAHGVPQEQVGNMPAQMVRDFGIQAPTRKTRPPARGQRRYRCMPGGKIEPFRHD